MILANGKLVRAVLFRVTNLVCFFQLRILESTPSIRLSVLFLYVRNYSDTVERSVVKSDIDSHTKID